jgi:serine/threonine-protein kinase
MSPEQIRSTASVDARSDVWSLGMVLYELVASAPAFLGDNVTDTCSAILHTEPRRLDDVRPEVPPPFADVVARCLQKDPANRFATVAELAIALLPFASARSLAIAESSEWIRRAAIQTIGGAGADAPVSSTSPFVSSGTRPNLPLPSPSPSVSIEAPVARPARHRRGLGIATAASMFIAALGVYHWIGGVGRTAENRILPAPIAAPSPPPAHGLATSPVDEPSASNGSASGSVPLGPSATPIRSAAAANAHAARAGGRAPVSSKAASSPSSSAAPSISGPPASAAAQPPAWQTVVVAVPSTRPVRAIDSSNPWSATK